MLHKDKIKMLSFNVRGLRGSVKRKHLFHIFRRQNYNFVMLQETHCTEDDVKIWTSQWGGDLYFCNGTNNSRGVLTLVKKNLACSINKVIKDSVG